MSDDSKAISLRFIYPSDRSTSDVRSLRINQVLEGSSNETELYKFYHPFADANTGTTTTTFHRMNLATNRWETAGEIEYRSLTPITVHFGIEAVHARDLRKLKKSSSKSRRFKAGGSEYKWKIADNETDLVCVDSRGKPVAKWSQQALQLLVAEKVQGCLDRIVITCMLNVWWKKMLNSVTVDSIHFFHDPRLSIRRELASLASQQEGITWPRIGPFSLFFSCTLCDDRTLCNVWVPWV